MADRPTGGRRARCCAHSPSGCGGPTRRWPTWSSPTYPGRVAKALLDLGERFGTQTDEGIRVTHDLTQEELAQLVGASRETVNKALSDFVSRGWIRLEGRTVTLLEPERVERRAR